MTPPRTWLRRLRAFFNRSESERDLNDEVRFHLEMEAAELARGGAPHDDAAREARRRFGGVDRYAEEMRDARGGRRVDAFLQDLRYALRLVRRAPGFATTVILTLGLAIGATTAVFSVINAELLRPLPFPRASEIVRVYAQNPDASQPRFSVSYADYLEWRRDTHSFTDIAAFGGTTITITSDGEPERLAGLVTTANLFEILGVQPALGRLFGPGDAEGNGSPSIVLSYGLWKRRFGGDSSIIGRTVPLVGQARTVVGILPQNFLDGRNIDAVIVLAPANLPDRENHAQHLFESIARLKPGVTIAQAQQDLRDVAAQLARTHPEIAGWSANVFGFLDENVRGIRGPLYTLLGAAALVLLIGCMNVANLFSVRAATRAREVGLRQALGASRSRLVSQLLVESIVLAAIGGALGLAIAVAGTRLMITLIPRGTLPRFEAGGIDSVVFVFAAAVSIMTAVVVGLWPALRATSPRITQTLRDGGRSSTGGVRGARVRRALVVAEISVALVLLVCSGLVLQSLFNIVNVDPGFSASGVSTMRLTLGGSRYAGDTSLIAFHRELQTRLEARPGIEAVGAANTPPISGGGINTPIRVIGRVMQPGEQLMTPAAIVTPGYFRTMGMRLIRGRDFSWTDNQAALVLSEAAARRLWPDEDAIGKRIAFGRNDNVGLEIVGIIGNTRARGLVEEPTPLVYIAYAGALNLGRTMSLVVRGTVPPDVVLATTRSVLKELDPNLPLYNVNTVQQVIDQSIAQPRLNTTLLAVFAALALVLAGIGVYGVVSFTVTQRVQEFGVRMALGARRTDVLRLVLREVALLAGGGLVLGAAGAVAATTTIRTWLFGVERGDVPTFAITALALATIAVAAAVLPARRATRVDPVLAMRGE